MKSALPKARPSSRGGHWYAEAASCLHPRAPSICGGNNFKTKS